MKVERSLDGNTLTISVEGRLDLNSAPELEKKIELQDEVENLIFDFEKLEYISSAGLRVILALQDIMQTRGTMIIKNLNDDVKEVFEITGLSSELNIE